MNAISRAAEKKVSNYQPQRRLRPAANPKGPLKCEYCSRVFARTEHLARHRRTHTGETPYQCGVCRKSFQRADVRATHEKSCSDTLASTAEGNERARKRVRRACLGCRGRKVACDGQQPCGSCRTRSQQCYHEGDTDQIVISPEPVPVTLSTALVRDSNRLNQLPPQQIADFGTPTSRPEHNQGTHLPDVNGEGLDFFPLQDNTTLTGFDDVFDLHGLWSQPVEYNWMEETDLYGPGLFEQTEQPSVLASPTLRLTTYMSDYFDSRSRQVSPSRNTRRKMWSSTPPNLRSHDSDIVKIFLELFKRHVPPVFDLYREAAPETTKHSVKYIFAMAAVGGLFSVVSGSIDVANVMYNDARRLLLAEFILLDVYGLCSGHIRSYEIGEAFQGSLITAVTEYAQTLSSTLTESEDTSATKLLEALYVLDSYRVVIMLRPPSMMWHNIARCATPNSKLAQTVLATNSIIDGNINPHGLPSTLTALASLAPNLWSALRPSRDFDGGDVLPTLASCLHRPDFVELAIDKCAQVQHLEHCKSLADLSLYHAMCIMLHTRLTVLQTLVYINRSSTQADSRTAAAPKIINTWLKSHEHKIACWHAERLLAAAENLLPSIQMDSTQKIEALGDQQNAQHEAPHVPSAIYYAILVLYVKAAFGDSELSPSQIPVPILRGERILSLLRAPIAKSLARVVREIGDLHIKQ
ncbi:hypothetical protein DM02DRAFT_651798 [Periconia macrospinosa]|uniref:Zn(2)-C6 fungal-type domain-containing protein n=1 Tax=Periconia macrospinosa TaxID=97972 RepID=A0A2V1E232_9PLEO|nr:hypothetical protein DM02DRAFT_651798 [Periconia macrospinosa]